MHKTELFEKPPLFHLTNSKKYVKIIIVEQPKERRITTILRSLFFRRSFQVAFLR